MIEVLCLELGELSEQCFADYVSSVRVRGTGGSCHFFFSPNVLFIYHLLVEIVKILFICALYVESLVVRQWLGAVVGINVLESCLLCWVHDKFI
jgi:hypothetical protein